MSSPIIQPLPPRDGRDYACQCARCGSSCDYYHCEYCDGDGFVENDEPDPECDEAFIDCPDCGGKPTSWSCLSSREWCEANPLPGREKMKRGAIEWFEVDYGGGE